MYMIVLILPCDISMFNIHCYIAISYTIQKVLVLITTVLKCLETHLF